jgi:hypothetical protein
MTPLSTYKGLVNQLHRSERELPELLRSAGEAVSALVLAEARSAEASRDFEARAALLGALEALDADLRERGDEPEAARDAKRRRRAAMAREIAVQRSMESDAHLDDREAWALSVREMARARARNAVSDLETAMRVLEGEARRLLDGAAAREASSRAA